MLRLLSDLQTYLRAKFTGVPVNELREVQRLLSLYRMGRYYALLGLNSGAPATEVAAAVSRMRRDFGNHAEVTDCLNKVFAVLNPPSKRAAYLAARQIFRTVLQECPERARSQIEARLWPEYWQLIEEQYRGSAERIKSKRDEIVRWLKNRL